jgi:hypothetical protein
MYEMVRQFGRWCDPENYNNWVAWQGVQTREEMAILDKVISLGYLDACRVGFIGGRAWDPNRPNEPLVSHLLSPDRP